MKFILVKQIDGILFLAVINTGGLKVVSLSVKDDTSTLIHFTTVTIYEPHVKSMLDCKAKQAYRVFKSTLTVPLAYLLYGQSDGSVNVNQFTYL